MPQYEGTEVLTIGKFDQARKVVADWFAEQGYEGMPTPYKPGHEGPMWVLSLEGADDWAIRITQDKSVTWPDGVFAEPVAGWCLGLYPDDSVSRETSANDGPEFTVSELRPRGIEDPHFRVRAGWDFFRNGKKIGVIWETERGYNGELTAPNTNGGRWCHVCGERPFRQSVIDALTEYAERNDVHGTD